MDYHIAIPSYRRAEMLGKKTLRFLTASGAPTPTVYVADQQDFDAYRALYPDLPIVIAEKGLVKCRNFIQNNLPLGTKIVFIDDDIEDIFQLDFASLPKQTKTKVRDFGKLIELGFACAEKAGTTFWGVYPTDMTMCLKPCVRRNLCYMVGAFYGVVNSRTNNSCEWAEDFDRTLLYWEKEGRLCRLEFIGVNTKYYTNKGGLQETRNEVLKAEDCYKLAERCPTLCKAIKKRGHTELSFRRFPANMIDIKEIISCST